MTGAAIRALVRKDLRELAPVLVALAVLILVALVDAFVLDAADARACTVLGWLGGERDASSGWVAVVFGFVVASALLAGEHQQRTIDFLWALPIGRRALLLTKLAVGAGVMLAFHLADFATSAALCALHHDSLIRRQLDPGLMLLRLGLDSVLQLIGLCHGVLLAFFRRLGWVLLLVMLLGAQAARAVDPRLSILNLSALTAVEHFGKTPLVPWSAWLLHATLAAAALVLADRLWLTRTERFAAVYQRIVSGVWLRRGGLVLGLLAAVALTTALLGAFGVDGDQADPAPVSAAPTATLETRHFHFTYRPADEARARLVAGLADQTYQDVRRFLGAPDTGRGRVIADLTERSNEHAGLAGWQRMRMDLDRRHSEAFLAYVLRHEVTHVVAQALGGEAPDERWGALRFFSEGLADYVAYEVSPPGTSDQQRRHSRGLAAHWRSRFQVQFEALQEPASFTERHPEAALYAFGELWVWALVETCGPGIPGRLLRRLGDRQIARSLRGSALWRQALAREGCPFERARSRYEGELRRLALEGPRLPVASARFLSRDDRGRLSFEVSLVGPQPGSLPVLLMVRDGPHTPPPQIRARRFTVEVGGRAPVNVDDVYLEGDRFEYMVGARPSPDGHPVWSRWQSTSLVGK